jgi:hypothetical protein
MDYKTVFRLTFDDFESVLGRDLTDDEKDTVLNKFSLGDWWEEVECFLDIHNIKGDK